MNTIYALNNPIVRRATTVLELFYIMLMNLCQFQEKLIYKKKMNINNNILNLAIATSNQYLYTLHYNIKL